MAKLASRTASNPGTATSRTAAAISLGERERRTCASGAGHRDASNGALMMRATSRNSGPMRMTVRPP